MKKNKTEKRRLQLNKRHEKNNTQKMERPRFSKPTDSKLFVKANGSEAVRAPLNKRLLAVILAIVFVIGVIPSAVFLALKGRAEEEQTLRMDPVTMQVRINGESAGETQIEPGEISHNVAGVAINNPTNAEFVKAVIVDANGVETEIYSVGNKNQVDYYSVNENGYTGVAKGANDTLVLIYANRYKLNFANATENNGLYTVTGNVGTFRVTNVHHDDAEDYYYIYGGDNLGFREMTPAQDYTASSVSYQSASSSGTERVRNSSTTIVADSLSGNTNITVNFSPVSEYTVKDSRDISNSKYYLTLSGVENHGGTTNSLTTNTASLSSATEDTGWATSFYVFSQANSGSETWRLDMLSINGTDIPFPQTEGSTTEPVNVDGMTVTVTFVDEDGKFTGENNKPRTFYRLDLSNVHQNVEVAYYFVNTKNRTIMVKGLEGIEATGAAVEDEYLLNRYYTFDTNKYNIYTANYTAPGVFTGNNYYPSDNLILYQVKPGYNPYTVSTEMSYDFGVTKTSDGIREQSASGDTAAGTPLEVIKAAGNGAGLESTGRYNTSFRHWGANDRVLENYENNYRKGFRTYDLLLTTIVKDVRENGTPWYAVALAQNANKTQQLYLNASPYKYWLEVDVDSSSATLSDNSYTSESGTTLFIENNANGHKVVDANAFAYLPATTPTQSGKQFEGWQLVGADGETVVSEKLYSPSDRIDFDDETIVNAIGDVTGENLTIRFKAKWVDLKNADVTTVKVNSYYQTALSEDDAVKYTHVLVDQEESQVKGQTAFLNDMTEKSLDDHFIINSAKSELYKATKSTDNDGSYGSDNEFVVYYDYRLHTLSVSKSVFGYPKSKLYEITVVFTRDTTSPVDMDQAQNLITAKLKDSENVIPATSTDSNAGTITYVLSLAKDQVVDFTNVPYGWTYEVTEPEKHGDYTNEISNGNGTITKDTAVDVANLVDTEQLQTNKYIEFNPTTGKYDLTLEAWATGDKVTKYDKDPVPTDIALVIDQSGSMGQWDMESTLQPADHSTTWTIEEATGTTQYYYNVPGTDQYYPVQAMEGPLYEKVSDSDKPYALQMFGRGHDEAVGQNLNVEAKLHFNVPTNYYCLGTDGKIHKVWIATIGAFALYHAYPYYYYDDDNIYIPSDGDGLIKGSNNSWRLVDEGPEWRCTVGYVDVPFTANNWLKLTSSTLQRQYGGVSGWFESDDNYYLANSNLYNGVEPFIKMSYEHTIGLVGQTDTKIRNWDAVEKEYTFFNNGPQFDGDFYLPKDGTNYNRLCYVDDQGVKHEIPNTTIYVPGQKINNLNLYEYRGSKTRTMVLKEAVSNFVDLVQQNADENQVQHRMSIIGFAGNKTPALSDGTTVGYNGEYDYTNTGLFVNGDFINYNQIKSPDTSGYVALTANDTAYINRHYYIYRNNAYEPVLYSNGGWHPLSDSNVTVTKYTSNASNNRYIFYQAQYDTLGEDEYKDSLVDVNVNGELNEHLSDAIDQFASYGGTYTSYGMSMANQVFEYNQDDTDRNRIIVVFTDGEPGANGYDAAIAGEAIADANLAKMEEKYNAKVYTVALFPSSISSDAETFLNRLSSETSIDIDYPEVTKTGTDTELNVDPDYTYYYSDKNGKTYAVHAKWQGKSSLGWWLRTSSSYSQVTPRYASNDNRTYVTRFYNSGGTEVYEPDLDDSTTYYDSSGNPINYRYLWFDTDNNVVEPYGADPNGERFFELDFDNIHSKSPDDNTEYALYATNAKSLIGAFESIAESMSKSTVSLTGTNSVLRDIITGNFTNVVASNVKAYTVDGSYNTTTGEIAWAQPGDEGYRKPLTITNEQVVYPDPDNNQQTIVDVQGFDYSTQYISETHVNGQKLVVTITGLDPTQADFHLASNTGESGIYQINQDEDDSLLAAFKIPELNRPEYKLVIDGDDKTAEYTVKFLLKDADNNVIAADQWAKYLDAETISELRKDGSDYLAWSGKAADLNESIILEDVFKNLPDGYKVYATITKAQDDEAKYTYSVKLDNETAEAFGTAFELPRSGAEIDITSKRIPVDVVIKEITQGTDPTNDYSDKGKSFDIEVTLVDENGNDIEDDVTYGSTTYSEGKIVMSLHSEQSRTIQVPNGYSIKVREIDSDGYVDSYTKVYTVDGTEEDISKSAEVEVGSNYTRVTVYNTLDTTPQTGFLDNLKVNPFIIAAIGLAVIGAGWLAILEKRKRQMEEK